MYGQPDIERPIELKKADEDFIKNASDGFGSKEEASKVWWLQAEKFMQEGNLDFAMRRYNQSWLLNPDNYQPYWGFARVSLEQNKTDEAIQFLEKAEMLIRDPFQKVALLADLGSTYAFKGRHDPGYFTKANKKFAESTELDPNYPNSWRRWAYSLFDEGAYLDALEKVEMAKSLNARPFPSNFIQVLEAKLPKPQ